MTNKPIYIGKSKIYKGVYIYSFGSINKYGYNVNQLHDSERQAAISYDIKRINKGKHSVNIS